MNILFFWTQVILFLYLSKQILAPPPNRKVDHENIVNEKPTDYQNENDQNFDQIQQLSYNKYLEVVVKILEAQPKFQENLKGMKDSDLKAGKIADYIDDLDEDVFKRLTQEKLKEIERIQEQFKREGGSHNIKLEHLDLSNLENFGKEDLRKLIVSTIKDMDEIDKQRKENFKQYEMKKKAEEDHRLAQMTEQERNKELKEKNERLKAKENEKINHPGGHEQLEEVWEKTDHLNKDEYDPKTFFALHDINSDGFWNANEIEALFQLDLTKLYNESDPTVDSNERIEEMRRMREHMIQQIDKNKDGLISYDEFLHDPEAQNDNVIENEYKDLAHQQIYTDEELKEFEEQYGKNKGWTDNYNENHPQPTNTLSPPVTAEYNAQNQAIHNQNQQPIQPVVNNNYPSSQPNTFDSENIHNKNNEKKIDPVYGI